MRAWLRAVCGFLVGFSVCSPGLAQQADVSLRNGDPTEDAVRATVAQIAAKNHLGSVWFYMEENGTPRYDVADGSSEPDKPTPVGSISKSITGIGIALLIQDRKISLESTVADLLGDLFRRHDRPLEANLGKVTVERLLTHTAGLVTNRNTDPTNGMTTNDGLRSLKGYASPSAFDFLTANNFDKSTGSTAFLYSNISYLVLGLIIEEVSGQSYEEFCRRRIFGPLEIDDASSIGGAYQPVASYIGWELSRRDVAKVWRSVFDRNHPTLLTGATLDSTLLAPLGQPLRAGNVHYVMGAYVEKTAAGYVLYHDGQADTSLEGVASPGNFDSYVEDRVPGPLWSVAVSPIPRGQAFKNALHDFRALVGTN